MIGMMLPKTISCYRANSFHVIFRAHDMYITENLFVKNRANRPKPTLGGLPRPLVREPKV